MRKRTLSPRAWPSLALALLLVLTAQLSAVAQTCPVTGTSINGSIVAGDPTQTDRVFRDGAPSNCNGKTFPGNFGTTSVFRFDQHTFVNNSGAPACIEISLNATTNMHSVAYLNTFNPANISQNYLGDLGVVNTINTTQSYSVSVPDGATLVVVVHEATANGGGNYTLTLDCITAPPPLANQPGQILISEFRLSGPGTTGTGSQRDEFIELYNNTDQPRTIDNLVLRAYDPNFFGPGDGADFIQGFDPGTVIPARGHFLVGDGSAYSLPAYAALDLDTDLLFDGDFFIDNEGLQIITNESVPVVLDSVGTAGSGGRPGEDVNYVEGTPLPRRPQTAPTVQYAYVRKIPKGTGLPQDTNNNAADFVLVSVDGSVFPTTSPAGSQPSTLGAPGPENAASPIQRNAQIALVVIDSTVATSAAPNRVRDFTPVTNGTFGTLSIRRRVTNNTGAPVTRLRFRIIDLSTFPAPNGTTADLRALTSTDTTATNVNDAVTCGAESLSPPCTATVRGTTLEEPPAQANGGGINASLAVPSVTEVVAAIGRSKGRVVMATPSKREGTFDLNAPLTAGSSINVQFLLGVQQTGQFRIFVNIEALP